MIRKFARFANDTYCLWRTPTPPWRKIQLWLDGIHPTGRVLGLNIRHFDRRSLSNLYREIFFRQHYYFRVSGTSPLVFDCGANLGMATLYFKWLYPNARVVAFEPDPITFAVLKKNITQNNIAGVNLHNCALWSENGTIEFFVDPGTPGSALMSTNRTRTHGKAIQVPSRRLSDFITEPVDFLKLDVEGAEHYVLCDLLSSGKTRFIRQMVIEYHHHLANEYSSLADFLGRLERAGFEYQIHASLFPITSKGTFQDVLIGAYRDE